MLIDSKIICALKLFAGQKGIRYYLNGICWEGDKMVATNGVVIAVAQVPEAAPTSIIIPNEAFALTKPSGGKIEITPDRVGSLSYKPIDDKYPDWRRVLPLAATGEVAQFDPDFIAVLSKASKLVGGFPRIAHNGRNVAIVRFGEREDFFAGVMPFDPGLGRKPDAPPLPQGVPDWALK